MKIRLLSDLHMEGRGYKYNYLGEDLLILAGDIHTQCKHAQFLEQATEVPNVLFVPGNHEYYHGGFDTTNAGLKDLEQFYPNFRFLNNEWVVIDGIAFFGGTMWTNFLLYGETEMWFATHDAKRFIADYAYIEGWTIERTIREFQNWDREFNLFLKATEGMRRQVITHFVPHEKCIHPRWDKNALNPYFTNNLDCYMGLVENWFCGHTHDAIDVEINGTHVYCNPRGYRGEDDYNPNLIVEI